ncbi:hypothetical protein Q5H93_12395 [Hymenobacter sp. ASUV-10]|uniref:Uncharacterized protein n=1 Tax=Hymenobacter aranciens TaxID=3063996 RepID=A0ABT9BB89_9BACT|nr:hypothetical protein [Hymenobacter sp. ASUV-10]MDO7875535.1 hypothetical protein [Hymenobacter sp. ASUV-10]
MQSVPLSAISAWLASDRPFAQGAALYAAVGPSDTYKRLFGLAATDYSRQVLERELRALVHDVPAQVAAVAPPPPPAPPVAVVPAAVSAPAPAGADSPLLVDVRQQLKAVRDERSHIHPQLTGKNVGTKARQAVALRIVELTDQEVALKAAEAHVLAHGRLPGPVATADVEDEGELRRRLLNLRSRRSRLRQRPERADDLATVKAEITLIESKLKSLKS